MMPPMSRVLAPQLLCCGCTRSPASFRNWVPKAFAKLSPRSWLVPACAECRTPQQEAVGSSSTSAEM